MATDPKSDGQMADKKGRFELNIFFIIESGNAEVIKKATPVI